VDRIAIARNVDTARIIDRAKAIAKAEDFIKSKDDLLMKATAKNIAEVQAKISIIKSSLNLAELSPWNFVELSRRGI